MTQRILITGASSGIGKQLAQDYLAQGAQVFGCGRNLERLQATPNLQPLVFDITQRDQVQQSAALLQKTLMQQKLDLLILNAGDCEYMDDPSQFDDLLFERILQTNLISIGYCLTAFLPLMATHGRIALISSSAAYLPLPRAEAYGASKAALNYLAHTLQISLAKQPTSKHLNVSLVCPGFVQTPLTDKNDFPMPMRLSVVQASKRIRQGLAQGKREIHFPKRFTGMMKLLALLPTPWWQKLIASTIKEQHKDVL